jgi:RNA polymerase sigma-70 factor (ECF subfamily)
MAAWTDMSQDETKEASPLTANAQKLDELVKRSQQGDPRAMEALYLLYKRPVFSLAYRHSYDTATAEDLLQETFIRVFTNIHTVERSDTFSGWVYRIALNTCYSHLRRKKSMMQKTLPLGDIEGKMDEAVFDSHETAVTKPLDEAIQLLPEKLRTIFVLHDVQGFKHEEIAGTLRCSVGTSKSQLFKARLRIRKYLKDKGIL